MGSDTTPVRAVSEQEFRERIRNKRIVLSPHALDHITVAERKVFKEESLIRMLTKETPRKAYLQANGNCAAYYRTSDGYRKLIIAGERDTITIVTFMDVDDIPRIGM